METRAPSRTRRALKATGICIASLAAMATTVIAAALGVGTALGAIVW